MTVKWHQCPTHGQQPSKIVGRDGVPRCPECGRKMDSIEFGTDGPGTPKR